MVPRWRFLATFLRPVFSASRVQQISDMHSKFALATSYMVDIQSPTAEIRRGKKEEEERKKIQRRWKPQLLIMACPLLLHGGHN